MCRVSEGAKVPGLRRCPNPGGPDKGDLSVLGMPLGNAKFVSNFCSTYANTGEQLCDQLSSLNDVQALRYCSSIVTFHH